MTNNEAIDILYALVLETLTSVGVEVIVWPNVENKLSSDLWARVSVQSGGGDQNSLSDDTGNRIWTVTGTLYVECFIAVGGSTRAHTDVSDALVAAFRIARHPVIFYRRPRSLESKPDGGFLRRVFMVDFEYDTIG
jgi:hypothetical protein